MVGLHPLSLYAGDRMLCAPWVGPRLDPGKFMRRLWTLCLIPNLLIPVACRRGPAAPASAAESTYIPSPGAVPFDISHTNGKDEIAGEWKATYAAGGKVAHFRIVIDPAADGARISADGHGRIIAESGSDPSILLPELGKALEADEQPKSVKRLPELPFEYANLGDHFSKDLDGAFQSQPAGHWTSLKLFIDDGDDRMGDRDDEDDQAEVLLNLNTALKKGEFAIRDPDYGDDIVGRLAQVL